MARNVDNDTTGNLKTFVLVAVGVMIVVVALFVMLGNPTIDNLTPVSAPGTAAPITPAK